MIPDNHKDLEDFFTEIGALWKYPGFGPHAITVLSKKHYDCYFNSDMITSDPDLMLELCKKYFIPVIKNFDQIPEVIFSYEPYGVKFGKTIAKLLNCKFSSVNLDSKKISGNEILPEEKVLLVTDDIYGGGSMARLKDVAKSKNARVIPVILCFANLSNKNYLNEQEIFSLISPLANSWNNGDKSPLPEGSVGLSARENWDILIGK